MSNLSFKKYSRSDCRIQMFYPSALDSHKGRKYHFVQKTVINKQNRNVIMFQIRGSELNNPSRLAI